jgi:hypothetical protein
MHEKAGKEIDEIRKKAYTGGGCRESWSVVKDCQEVYEGGRADE